MTDLSKRPSWRMLWIGWALFLLSLCLPAVKLDWGAWNNPDNNYAWGIGCALIFPYFYPSNTLLLLAPLLFRACQIERFHRWPRMVLALLLFLSAIGALCCLPMFLSIHLGYILWTFSFILVGIALICLPKGELLP